MEGVIMLSGILGIILWIASISMVVADAKARGFSHVGWGCFTFLMPGLGLLIYAIVSGSGKAWALLFFIIILNIIFFFLLSGSGGSFINQINTQMGTGAPQVTFSDGVMEEVNNSGVEADIDVDPNYGTTDTQVTITVDFTSGADRVSDIVVYSFSPVVGWDVPVFEGDYTPRNIDYDTWLEDDLYYTDDRSCVLRFYAYTHDGNVVAVGDIDKNGGGPAVSWEHDGIGAQW